MKNPLKDIGPTQSRVWRIRYNEEIRHVNGYTPFNIYSENETQVGW